MRRFFASLAAGTALTVMLAGPVTAHQGGPCNDSGDPGNSDYAMHHIVPFAQDGGVGSPFVEGNHNPGTHQGFSLCDPSGS